MKKQILTANSLHSGGVVFLSKEGKWSTYISKAWVSDNSEMVQLFESLGSRAVKNQLIVEPYLLDISIENGLPTPIRFREQIRVNGLTFDVVSNKSSLREVA